LSNVVIVTDRRRFASEEIAGRLAAIFAAVPRGSVSVQVREKDLDGRPLLALVREVLEVARPAGAEVWVNDRVDVALVAGADGVHLPERGIAICDARAVAPGLAIGCSRHTVEGVAAAGRDGAAYVQLGPIWDSPGKGPALGTGVLREAASHGKIVAVGGIDSPERARAAIAAGAHAIAIIRAAWTDSVDRLAEIVQAAS
jgi:thiamine-phosphate pyrophosphorylase